MNRCPITYDPSGENKYSLRGLKLLSNKLTELKDFPYTAKEQLQLASELATKLSIQGIQPKLSVILDVKDQLFKIVEKGGNFIVKPPHQIYDELPQNEDLTMRLASIANIPVPFHGMFYNKDGTLSYFIKRFDRLNHGRKLAVEDLAQILGSSRHTKYDSSMEKILSAIEKHTTFPLIEKLKFFRLTLFNFLTGNEDAHLKNFSFLRDKGVVELSPVYDLLNTSIVVNSKEELALPLRGKKSRFTVDDFINYFGREGMGLEENLIEKELLLLKNAIPKWLQLIDISFLSSKNKERYKELLLERSNRLFSSGL